MKVLKTPHSDKLSFNLRTQFESNWIIPEITSKRSRVSPRAVSNKKLVAGARQAVLPSRALLGNAAINTASAPGRLITRAPRPALSPRRPRGNFSPAQPNAARFKYRMIEFAFKCFSFLLWIFITKAPLFLSVVTFSLLFVTFYFVFFY